MYFLLSKVNALKHLICEPCGPMVAGGYDPKARQVSECTLHTSQTRASTSCRFWMIEILLFRTDRVYISAVEVRCTVDVMDMCSVGSTGVSVFFLYADSVVWEQYLLSRSYERHSDSRAHSHTGLLQSRVGLEQLGPFGMHGDKSCQPQWRVLLLEGELCKVEVWLEETPPGSS